MTMAESRVPGRVPIKWGRVLLPLAIGGVPAAVCFIFGLWWWGTLCLLLTLLVACLSFPRAVYPIVFTVFAMFAIAWLTGAWLDVALHRDYESAWWRDALPILGGFAIGVIVPVFFWFVTFVVSSKWVLGLPESHEIKWRDAFIFVSTRAFGLALPYVKVENGKLLESLSTRGLLANFANPELVKSFGGPGILVVGEGNAVVLERGGKFSRVLGEGTYRLERGEWFKRPVETKGIHDLRPGGGPPLDVEKVMTKDGVPLEFKILGRCHLERKAETDARPASRYDGAESSSPVIGENSQYPIYQATILKAVYKTGDSGWKTAFPTRAVSPLRDAVAKYTLGEIMGMSEAGQGPASGREVVRQIEAEVKAAVGQGPLGQGIVLDFVAILDITVPEKTQKAMEDRWAEPIQSRLSLQEAQIKRREKIAESEGKAASIIAVETARHNASDAWVDLLRDLRELLPRVEDQEVARQFAALVQKVLLRVGEDDLEGAIRMLNRIQWGPDQSWGMQRGYWGAPGPLVGPSPGSSPQPSLPDGASPAEDTQ